MKSRSLLLGILTALSSGGDVTLHAATSLWSGNVDTLWSTSGNWNIVPTVGDNILFPNVTGQTVDLGAGTYSIGSLTFNAPDAYAIANGGVTLGGNFSNNGGGTVTLNADIDLGGADRAFGGSGDGVVTLNNAINGNANSAIFGPGNSVIANAANTVNQIVATNGGNVVFQGTDAMADYPNPSYFGGNGTSGGGYVKVDGGVIDYQPYYTDTTGSNSADFIGDWAVHGIEFGPNGGTLLMNSKTVDQGPTLYRSYTTNGIPGTIVIGEPMPYTGDGRNGTNYAGPWDVPTWGLTLGPNGNDGRIVGAAGYSRRLGEGDLVLSITNGATAALAWSVMSNGNLIIKGHPFGNSAVAEVDSNGTSRNVGRLAIRGVHRGTQQSGYQRAFYLNQPYGIHFHDALQIWNRENTPFLACDLTFEPGSSVDFSAGKNDGRPLRLGYATGDGVNTTATNYINIMGGGRCNLNLQLRTQHWEGNGPSVGDSSVIGVFSFITIQDNGELKIYRSQTNSSSVRVIELFRPITGRGTTADDARMIVNLPFAESSGQTFTSAGIGGTTGGVNFNGLAGAGMGTYPGANLIVHGAGDYGLRIQGAATNLWNVMGNGRYGRVTGSGGTLTLAVDNNETLDVDGPTNVNCVVSLGLDSQGGSTPTYNLLVSTNLLNYAGLVLKGGTAAVNDSSSVSIKTLKLAGSATIRLGSGAGGAVVTFSNSSVVGWNAGTLTISSWNGSASGGGSDQIKFGTDATGLTAGQLAQIRWINPYGGGDVASTRILSTGEIVPVVPAPSITAPTASIAHGEFVCGVEPGYPGQTSVVQRTTNLNLPVIWVNILTNTGRFNFTNPATLPAAFYRLVVP
jgi:hypothetical protein